MCAICGFAYELVIIALGTILFGSSTAQTAMVLGTFVAAMGLGAWLAAKVPERHAVAAFAAIEAAVALLGGLSALALFASYAWLDLYEPMVRAVSVALGVLVGAELPLLAAVLDGFESRTGLPVLVNTSLNTAGRPIVDTPPDVLELFGSAPVDVLAIGPFLVRRHDVLPAEVDRG